jgi:hypothetical protein
MHVQYSQEQHSAHMYAHASTSLMGLWQLCTGSGSGRERRARTRTRTYPHMCTRAHAGTVVINGTSTAAGIAIEMYLQFYKYISRQAPQARLIPFVHGQ